LGRPAQERGPRANVTSARVQFKSGTRIWRVVDGRDARAIPSNSTSARRVAHRAQVVLSSPRTSNQIQRSIARRASWLTSENAKIHRVLANRNPAQNIAALRVRAPVTQSSSIAIAVTKSARAIFSQTEFATKRHKKHKGIFAVQLGLSCVLCLLVALVAGNRG